MSKNLKVNVEVTDPNDMPDWTKNWVGIGMSKDNPEFLAKFNVALAKVLGTDAMMEAVKPYGYTKFQLPGPDASTAFACANR